MKSFVLTLLLLFVSKSIAQTITGSIKSTTGEILQNTNVIAREKQGEREMKFAIADHQGRYKLHLEKQSNYIITVNHIGFEGQILNYSHENPITTHDFILSLKSDSLKEIIIDYKYQPIIVKKDTIIYDVASFINGTEYKLRDQLSKLPGVEVTDTGDVFVHGKKVIHFLVEGTHFFGGNTKLGVENIPADAVEQVEVIDHFTEVAHMKEVVGSNELAMNIKLKEDKKKFVFGDLLAGYGNNHFYESNIAAFYYAPKINWSLLANLNNFGSELVRYQDIIRTDGLNSHYIKKTPQQPLHLNSLTTANKDALQNKNQFISSELRYTFTEKWKAKTLIIVNKNWLRSQTVQAIEYLQFENSAFENRNTNTNKRNDLTSGKLSIEYLQNTNTTFNYNLQLATTSNFTGQTIQSFSENSTKELSNDMQTQNSAISQLFEFHKTFHKKHKTSFAISHYYNRENPNSNWFSDQSFLDSQIPWQSSNLYLLNETRYAKKNSISFDAKYYWIADIKHHIYTTIGYRKTTEQLLSSNKYLEDDLWSNLTEFGFGNNLKYNLNNPFIGIEHKFLFRKFTSTIGLFLHDHQLQNTYPTATYKFAKTILQPEVTIEYQFKQTESINFQYRLQNNYLSAQNYATFWQVNSFNALFKGNALLQQLQYQQANLRYYLFSNYSNFNTYVLASFNKRNKNVRNQVSMLGTDQFYEAEIQDQPDTNWNFSTVSGKRYKKIEIRLNSFWSFSRYHQLINTVAVPTKRNAQNYGLQFKTLLTDLPNLELHFNKSFNQLHSSVANKSNSSSLIVKTETPFFRNYILKADYSFTLTKLASEKNQIETASIYLEYKKTAWSIILKGQNLLNAGIRNHIHFSDFMIDNKYIYVLPRIGLLSVQYKL